ncbi:TRAP transporter large permease [Microbacterium sp. Mu-80]|uniref:TRAP transporter large permease n=1 Tax=Microbacterium bandirmense TaxID=3122050 RepID=A0ABU8LF56_9MICO
MTALIFIGLFIVLLVTGIPVAFAMMGTTLAYFVVTNQPDELFVQRFISGMESFPLLAIPFFTLAGVVMARSGIAERIIDFAASLVGHFRGGLAQVNVLNSMVIGGMSGSGTADAAIDSKILVPQMVRNGYPKPFAAAVTATSGIMSAIIPPSIVLILYGLQANVSIGRLFVAGVIPAVVMALGLSIVVYVISRVRNYEPGTKPTHYFRHVGRTFVHAFWSLMMPVLLLVGLRVGIFTPTELGALAAVYTLVLAFAYRTIRWRDLISVLREAATLTASIMLIIAAASAFGYFVTIERLPRLFTDAMTGVTSNPTITLLLVIAILLLIGMFMESASLIIILAPLLAPLALAIGMDPVQFGVVVVMALAIGGTTPPVGSVLYTVMTITRVKLGALTKAQVPFLVAMVVALVVVALIPALSLWLPGVFYPN